MTLRPSVSLYVRPCLGCFSILMNHVMAISLSLLYFFYSFCQNWMKVSSLSLAQTWNLLFWLMIYLRTLVTIPCLQSAPKQERFNKMNNAWTLFAKWISPPPVLPFQSRSWKILQCQNHGLIVLKVKIEMLFHVSSSRGVFRACTFTNL